MDKIYDISQELKLSYTVQIKIKNLENKEAQ